MHAVHCSVRRALYAMQLVPNQCAGARSAGAGGQHGTAWPRHGMQCRRDSGFTWAACCMLHDVRCWLRVACPLHVAWRVCVCLCVCVSACAHACVRALVRVRAHVCVCVRVLHSTVGAAAIGCRLAALGVHSVATGRRRCPLHERVALVWLPCRRAAMRRSSPSWCSSEPTWRSRARSGILLDRAACTVQQAHTVQADAMNHAADTMQADTVQRVPSTEPCARCIDAADNVRRASRVHALKRVRKRATLSSFVAAGRR